jgi:xanthine dehydrogenase iron-sulfur cluster and FAD-binding subunit A
LLESRKGQRTTVQDIEDVLDGNLCRCTGYRPIFDAFKSLANVDNPIPDIEDMRKCPINKNGSRGIGKIKSSIDGVDWYMPTTVNDLMTVLAQLAPETTYRYSFSKYFFTFCLSIGLAKD